MRERIETILTVIVVTLLVWLYAEGRVATSYTDQRVLLNFETRSGAPIDYRGPERVSVSFKASPSIKREFDQLAAAGVTVVVDDLVPGIPDQRTLVLSDILNETDLGRRGVAVLSTSPATAEVQIIRLRTVTVPVQYRTQGFDLVPPPVIDPREVSLTLPESVDVPESDLFALLSLDASDLGGLVEGVERSQSVRLQPSPAAVSKWTALSPSDARITYTVKQTRDVLELTTVPVRVNLPVGLAEEYAISVPESERFIPTLAMSGPVDAIQRVRSGEQAVWVELRPSREQLEAAAEAIPPEVELMPILVAPAGLTAEVGLTTVTVEVQRRAATAR
ncbi:MAG: hypothetical protein RIG82_00955 [Phycisphaeraceae bacterium]